MHVSPPNLPSGGSEPPAAAAPDAPTDAPPPEADIDENGVPLDLRHAAEQEMRRVLDDRPAKKRQRTGHTVGRFDYGAPATLADGATGFVLTCSMNREHSAMKEVGALLIQHVKQQLTERQPSVAPEAEPGAANGGDAPAPHAAPAEPRLHSVKLGCRGVVALKLALPDGADGGAGAAAVGAVAAIIGEVEAGRLPRLEYVQRIAPMQTSAALGTPELRAAGARLAAYVADALGGAGQGEQRRQEQQVQQEGSGKAQQQGQHKGQPQQHERQEQEGQACEGAGGAPAIKFAVAYAGRGSEAGQAAATDAAAGAAGGGKLPARMAAIGAIADGFSSALLGQHGIAAKVDLRAPDWVVLAEVLPMAGEARVALAAVPAAHCAFTKARTSIKVVGQPAKGGS